jgi:hypothetical protein
MSAVAQNLYPQGKLVGDIRLIWLFQRHNHRCHFEQVKQDAHEFPVLGVVAPAHL